MPVPCPGGVLSRPGRPLPRRPAPCRRGTRRRRRSPPRPETGVVVPPPSAPIRSSSSRAATRIVSCSGRLATRRNGRDRRQNPVLRGALQAVLPRTCTAEEEHERQPARLGVEIVDRREVGLRERLDRRVGDRRSARPRPPERRPSRAPRRSRRGTVRSLPPGAGPSVRGRLRRPVGDPGPIVPRAGRRRAEARAMCRLRRRCPGRGGGRDRRSAAGWPERRAAAALPAPRESRRGRRAASARERAAGALHRRRPAPARPASSRARRSDRRRRAPRSALPSARSSAPDSSPRRTPARPAARGPGRHPGASPNRACRSGRRSSG